MANIKSAQKQARQSEVRRKRNLARKTSIKTAIKKVLSALENNQEATEVKGLLRDVEVKLARAKSKNLLHKNTASRKLSKIAKKVAAAHKKSK